MQILRRSALAIALTAASAALPSIAAAAPAPNPGGELVPATASQVLEAVRAPGARAVLVNVWATWCLPCRAEMPDLLRLRRTYADRGLRVILVSGDFSSDAPDAAAFLHEQGVDFPTYIKKGGDMEFINAFDPQWSGTLPASFIYDGQGHLRFALHGAGSYEQFEEKVRSVLE